MANGEIMTNGFGTRFAACTTFALVSLSAVLTDANRIEFSKNNKTLSKWKTSGKGISMDFKCQTSNLRLATGSPSLLFIRLAGDAVSLDDCGSGRLPDAFSTFLVAFDCDAKFELIKFCNEAA